MAFAPLLAFDPTLPLSHLEYSSIEAQNDLTDVQDDADLEETLQALAALYDSFARFVSVQLARFHRLQRSALVSKCANLSLREDDQALVKSTLRTFLGQITTAFEAFVGLAASSSAHSALAPPTHPFLSITVSDNIEPIDLEELKRSLEAEHALEERELGGILQEMHSLVQAVAVAIVSAKHRSDSIRHRELTDSEQSHCAHELKNERLRQSILAFIASIRGAQQTLIAEDGGSAE